MALPSCRERDGTLAGLRRELAVVESTTNDVGYKRWLNRRIAAITGVGRPATSPPDLDPFAVLQAAWRSHPVHAMDTDEVLTREDVDVVTASDAEFGDYEYRLTLLFGGTADLSPPMEEYLRTRLRILRDVRHRYLMSGDSWTTADVTRHRLGRVAESQSVQLSSQFLATTPRTGTAAGPRRKAALHVDDAPPGLLLSPTGSAHLTDTGPTSPAMVPQALALPASTTALARGSGAGRGRISPSASPAAMAPAVDISHALAAGGCRPVPARRRLPAKLTTVMLQPPEERSDRAGMVNQVPTANAAGTSPATTAVQDMGGRQSAPATAQSAVLGRAPTVLAPVPPIPLSVGPARLPCPPIGVGSKRPSAGEKNVQAARTSKSSKVAVGDASACDLTGHITTTVTTPVWSSLPQSASPTMCSTMAVRPCRHMASDSMAR